jgi:hypothetical protein
VRSGLGHTNSVQLAAHHSDLLPLWSLQLALFSSSCHEGDHPCNSDAVLSRLGGRCLYFSCPLDASSLSYIFCPA